MASIGLGLAAYGGYQARDRQIKAEDYQDRQRAYGSAQMDAEQPGLQDAAAARTAANQLSTARSNAEFGLTSDRTQLAKSQLSLAQGEVNGKLGLQSVQQDTAAKQAGMQNQQANQDYETFAEKLSRDRLSGAISNQELHMKALGGLASAIGVGKDPALNFYNAIIKSRALGDLQGPFADDVQMIKGPDGIERITFLAGGKPQPLALTQEQLGRVSQYGQKADIKTLKSGETLVGVNPRTGQTTEMYRAPIDPNAGNKNLPTDIQTANWLHSQKIAPTIEAAYRMARSSKSMSENAFVADYVKGKTKDLGAGDPLKIADEGRKIYRYINAQGGADDAVPGASNTGTPPTLDPDISSLFPTR